MENWISDNWFNLLSVLGIVASLLFTAVSLRSETKNRRISSLLSLTENHRKLWGKIFSHPELARILDADADLSMQPITLEESMYVGLIIQHLASAYQALKAGIVIQQQRLCDDVRAFFLLPIPKAVWKTAKSFQNGDFVDFVESNRKTTGRQTATDAVSPPPERAV